MPLMRCKAGKQNNNRKYTEGESKMEVEELVNKITKQAKLSYYESDMLLHDINNLRGDEWLETINARCSKETIREFKNMCKGE